MVLMERTQSWQSVICWIIYEQTIVEVIPLGHAESGTETMANESGRVRRELVKEDKIFCFNTVSSIHPVSRTVYINDQEIVLTKMEFDGPYFLASNSNMVFTKGWIYEAVSKDDYSGGSNIKRDLIYRIRTKLQITNI